MVPKCFAAGVRNETNSLVEEVMVLGLLAGPLWCVLKLNVQAPLAETAASVG